MKLLRKLKILQSKGEKKKYMDTCTCSKECYSTINPELNVFNSDKTLVQDAPIIEINDRIMQNLHDAISIINSASQIISGNTIDTDILFKSTAPHSAREQTLFIESLSLAALRAAQNIKNALL